MFYFAICGSVVYFQRLCHVTTGPGSSTPCGIVDQKATQMIRKLHSLSKLTFSTNVFNPPEFEVSSAAARFIVLVRQGL
jgi:hypothetical protein